MRLFLSLFFFIGTWVNLYSQNNQLEKVELRYPNGKIRVEATSLNGKKHGISKTYYPNGILESRNNWKNDVQIGETTHWFPNGFLSYEGFVSYGYENGPWRYYDGLDGDYIYNIL